MLYMCTAIFQIASWSGDYILEVNKVLYILLCFFCTTLLQDIFVAPGFQRREGRETFRTRLQSDSGHPGSR